MTTTVSPFRLEEDARSRYEALARSDDWPASDAAWRDLEAAQAAAVGYELTPREQLERSARVWALLYRELLDVEAAGGSTDDVLRSLWYQADMLAAGVVRMRQEGGDAVIPIRRRDNGAARNVPASGA